MIVHSNGRIYDGADVPDTNGGVRPVVSLKQGVAYTQGTGATNDPYIIEGAKDYRTKNLYNQIKSQAVADNIASTYVSSSDGINLLRISSDTNGKGVYQLTSSKVDSSTGAIDANANPIYYYRGNVTNNNVLFANFCWKMIRTTDTGGIKLIYNGVPTDGKCTATGSDATIGNSAYNEGKADDAKYVGYMYDQDGTQTNSTIKGVIDTWYGEHLTSYTSYLEDTPFYNERNIGSSNGSHGYFFAAANRIGSTGSGKVKLGAANAEDKFTVSTSNGNGLLTYPVGLLTSDEMSLAGAIFGGGNKSGYLYTGEDYWSLTPESLYDGSTHVVISSSSTGGMFERFTTHINGIRPVVSLKTGIIYSSGDGTANTPYVIDATPTT